VTLRQKQEGVGVSCLRIYRNLLGHYAFFRLEMPRIFAAIIAGMHFWLVDTVA